MSLRRFPWILSIATLLAFAVLVSLGVWQLQRLAWKEDILARRAALESSGPAPIGQVFSHSQEPAVLDLVRVSAVCPGLDRAPFVELFGLAEGRPVRKLISACRLEEGPYDAILIDRGAVPEDECARPVEEAGDPYPVSVVGVLAAPQGAGTRAIGTIELSADGTGAASGCPPRELWMVRDLDQMAAALGVERPAPVFLQAETSSNPDWPALKPGLAPTSSISNNHLDYALTWFGLAAALLCVYAAMLFRRFKAQ